ncbi:unnamed protein product [Effrenium voratum]|uniref:Phosphoglycerate mutase n=1 Tax=Effrenium voratum TaxID=2562239 RepID=A0AA36IH18_9DINO|nr:unnamed protein product [Effrenium voratum]
MHILDDLRERNFGHTVQEPLQHQESSQSVAARVRSCFEWLLGRPEPALAVVSHNWILRAMMDPSHNRALHSAPVFEPFGFCELRAWALDHCQAGTCKALLF